MLDINLFRAEKVSGGLDRVCKSQNRRFASMDAVDDVVVLDKKWRERKFELDNLRKEYKNVTEEIKPLKQAMEKLINRKNELDTKIEEKEVDERVTEELKNQQDKLKMLITEKEKEAKGDEADRDAKLMAIGNLVHESVPISNDEADNLVVRTWGEPNTEGKRRNHVELIEMLGIAELEKGSAVAGKRGYFLKNEGVFLNMALYRFGLAFLRKRKYDIVQTPHFMTKDVMARCAQLAQFDEELYKVNDGGDDKYLIATSEQPLCAYHLGKPIPVASLPIRFAGFSTCFRKEAGSHGRDTLGIYRVHEFQKVEQFCITSPNGNDSWEMHEEMLKNSEDFYEQLKIPYRVVSVVSGALNDAAAKKYDLEAWFPASQTYRELVSCSNCTDYQSRRLDIRYGQNKNAKHVHMLNSTLTATERTMCCMLENYQREDGVEIPEVLQPFMDDGTEFIPFKQASGGNKHRKH